MSATYDDYYDSYYDDTYGIPEGNPLFTFTPPIRPLVPPVYINNYDKLFPVPLASHLLFSHYGNRDRGINLFVLADGTVTENQPWPITLAVKTYYGGHIYTLGPDDANELIAAGYEVQTAN